MTNGIRILPLRGIPELEEGDDLGALLGEAATRGGGLEREDVLVVAQKAVSPRSSPRTEPASSQPTPIRDVSR